MVIDRDSYGEPMVITHQHTLTQAEAIERLHGFTAALKRQWGDRVASSTEQWHGNTLSYYIKGKLGREFQGTVTATADVVEVTVLSESLSSRIARGIAETRIKAALTEALGD